MGRSDFRAAYFFINMVDNWMANRGILNMNLETIGIKLLDKQFLSGSSYFLRPWPDDAGTHLDFC